MRTERLLCQLKDDIPFAIEVLPDGKILLGGYSVGNDNLSNFSFAQFTADGNVDNNFGSSGKVITPVGDGYGTIADLSILPNGDIIADTAKNSCTAFDFAMAKYDQFGTLKTDFATQGFLFTDSGQNSDGINEAQLLPDGKMIVVGTGVNMSNSISEFLIARYVFDQNVATSSLADFVGFCSNFPKPCQ